MCVGVSSETGRRRGCRRVAGKTLDFDLYVRIAFFLAGKSHAMVIPPNPVRYNLGTHHAIACKRIRDKITN